MFCVGGPSCYDTTIRSHCSQCPDTLISYCYIVATTPTQSTEVCSSLYLVHFTYAVASFESILQAPRLCMCRRETWDEDLLRLSSMNTYRTGLNPFYLPKRRTRRLMYCTKCFLRRKAEMARSFYSRVKTQLRTTRCHRRHLSEIAWCDLEG